LRSLVSALNFSRFSPRVISLQFKAMLTIATVAHASAVVYDMSMSAGVAEQGTDLVCEPNFGRTGLPSLVISVIFTDAVEKDDAIDGFSRTIS
jgi:hypothetical protein